MKKLLFILLFFSTASLTFAQCPQGNYTTHISRIVDASGAQLMSVTEFPGAGDTGAKSRQILVSQVTPAGNIMTANYSYQTDTFTFYLPISTWNVQNQKTCFDGTTSGFNYGATITNTTADVPDITKFHVTAVKKTDPNIGSWYDLQFTYDGGIPSGRDIFMKLTRTRTGPAGTIVDNQGAFRMKFSGAFKTTPPPGDYTFEMCFEYLPLMTSGAFIKAVGSVTVPNIN